MRLIDAEMLAGLALRRSGVPHDLTISIDDIAAAPTIPTTTKRNGVTSCAFCGGVVDIEYPEASDD